MHDLFSGSAASEPRLDFFAILRSLAANQVEFMVVGGVSAVLNGAPINTFDLDIVHQRTPENLHRLKDALSSLGAYYAEHRISRLQPTTENLALPGHHLLTTRYGPLDVLGTIAGGKGYEELLPHAIAQPLGQGMTVRVLDLATYIGIKEALHRPKDQAVLHVLRQTLAASRKQPQDESG